MQRETIITLPDYTFAGGDWFRDNRIYVTRPEGDSGDSNILFVEGYARNGTICVIKYYDKTTKNFPKELVDETFTLNLRHNQSINIRIVEVLDMNGLLDIVVDFMGKADTVSMRRDEDGFIRLKPKQTFESIMDYVHGKTDKKRFPRWRRQVNDPSNFNGDVSVFASAIEKSDVEAISLINAITVCGDRVNTDYRVNRSHIPDYYGGGGGRSRKLFGISAVGKITDLFDKLEIPNEIYGPFMSNLSSLLKKKYPKEKAAKIERSFHRDIYVEPDSDWMPF